MPIQKPRPHLIIVLITLLVVSAAVNAAVTAAPAQFSSALQSSEAGIDIEKFISVDGVTWQDADTAPGPVVPSGGQVTFRFIVTNKGTVDLSNLTLADNTLDLSSCTLPALLPPGAFFECMVGPLVAADGQHTNTATASGSSNGVVVSDGDAAFYFSGAATPTPAVTLTPTPSPEGTAEATPEATPDGDNDLPITIIIEGPVQKININIITIYDIDIEVGEDDPILGIIQIGDILRVEGSTQGFSGTIVIIAVSITIINVDINIDTGEFWRDDGTCSNAPPSWAPAHGWRRRCGDSNGTTIIIVPSTQFVVPEGCKVTGTQIKCSKKSKKP